MKGLVAALLLLAAPAVWGQPDARDSVIIESKLTAPGGHPGAASDTGAYLYLKVYITNKDTLTSFALPVEIRSLSGGAFIVLGYPRNFNGTASRLTATLGPPGVQFFSSFANSTSPDSAIWAGIWDPLDTSTAEPPNLSRKAFWELKFDSVQPALGFVQIDSATIFDNRPGFVSFDGADVEVNFLKGIVTVEIPPVCDLGCPHPLFPVEVLFGRAWGHTFDDCGQGGRWSVVSGPGTIDSLTGVYVFSGQCFPDTEAVAVQFRDTAGNISGCSFGLAIVDNAPFSSPAQNTVTVSHGQTATNQINAADPDFGDGFVFSKLSGPGAVDSNGVWSYATGCEDVGVSPQTVRIQVFDAFDSCNPGLLADTCEFQLIVTNEAPVIANCPTDVIALEAGFIFSLQLAAADESPTTFSLVSGPDGFSLSSSGSAGWTPTASQTGLHSATVRLTDLCQVQTTCRLDFAVSLARGDLNADGVLTTADFVLILNCILMSQPPPAGRTGCDVNCNGALTGTDIILLMRTMFLGEPLPC